MIIIIHFLRWAPSLSIHLSLCPSLSGEWQLMSSLSSNDLIDLAEAGERAARVISFSHSNAETHTDSHQLILIKAIKRQLSRDAAA